MSPLQVSLRAAVPVTLAAAVLVAALATRDPAEAGQARTGTRVGTAAGTAAGGSGGGGPGGGALAGGTLAGGALAGGALAGGALAGGALAGGALAGGASTPDGTVTIAFAGDVHFSGRLAPLLNRPDTALVGLRPVLGAADVTVVNLETAITTRGTPERKQYRFRASPAAFRALAAAGVDVVTMANNHAVDYGPVGLADTLAARGAAPVKVVGIGENSADAYAPARFTVRGQRIAVIGASQINDPTLQHFAAGPSRAGIASAWNVPRLTAAIAAARRSADVVVVYLHWGTETKTCPDGNQESLARTVSRAGADVVVGSHAHRVQGAGRLGATYVDYGLGNFVWYNPASDGSSTTGVLTLTLSGRRTTSARWTPMRIGASGVPAPATGPIARDLQATWRAAQTCTNLSAVPPT